MHLLSRKEKSSNKPQSSQPLSWKWRWFRRIRRTFFAAFLLYLLILLIGLIPINNNFEETADGVEIFITSNGVHADVVMPVVSETMDWRKTFPAENFPGDISGAAYVAVGWGDKGFYVDTPTWDDFKTSTALKALFSPTPCCLHVVMRNKPAVGENVRSVTISKQQYEKMVAAVLVCNKYANDSDANPIFIPGAAYNQFDAFYEAQGNYHILNTCNSWVGWVMRKSEIKTPLLTPMPKTVFLYLPE